MQNNRDRLQAHRFLVGRLVSAVAGAEPDAAVAPMRRAARGWFYGLMVAVLLIAGFAVYGLVRGGGGKEQWRSGKAVIVDKQTGSRYILLGDGRLHPVLNLTSAMLALGSGSRPAIDTVSGSALAGIPRGVSVGIPGAPDVLPDPRRLATGPWTACQSTRGSSTRASTTVVLGDTAGAAEVHDDQALVVTTPRGGRHLIWQGRRFRITSDAVAIALAIGNARPLAVEQRWLNLFPKGADLRTPSIRGKGRSGPVVAGRPAVVGQVFQARALSGAVNYYLLLPDGMQPVTVTMAAILGSDPRNARLYDAERHGPLEVSAADIAAVPTAGSTLLDGGWPPTPPSAAPIADDDVVPCVRIVPRPGGVPSLQLSLAAGGAVRDSRPAASQPGTVNVEVEPGGGALVVSPGSGKDRTILYLITDQGCKYRIGVSGAKESDVATIIATLGYENSPIQLPESVVDLIPVGPALDPARAGKPPDERRG